MKSTEMKKLFPDIAPGSVSFLAMFDQFHEGVVITDRSGKILYFNEAQAHIDDLDPDEVSGQSVSDLYRVDDDDTPIMK